MSQTEIRPEPAAAEQGEPVERWLDGLDPDRIDFRDASGVRAIIAATEALAAAQDSLRQAVAQARAGGDSWTVIAAALGTSKQAAHERFRAVVQR